jgi:hypothetical protein
MGRQARAVVDRLCCKSPVESNAYVHEHGRPKADEPDQSVAIAAIAAVLVSLAIIESLAQLRPVILFAALDLNEFRRERPSPAV